MTLAPNDPRHGTINGYNNHGCRCDACRRAATEYHTDKCPDCGGPKRVVAQTCRSCYQHSRQALCGTERRYVAGCRCDLCRRASAEARRQRRAASALIPLPPDDARHGTRNGYVSAGCRCDRCRKANTEYSREYSRARRQRAAA